MSSEPAIVARGLGKRYTMFDRPADRLRQLLWGSRRSGVQEFWALRGVDFEIGRGEVLGVVGRNGAGKSTLLQMVCGTLTPTEGEIRVEGRVAALLELGAGFNPDFSGLENVYLNAALMGLSRAEVDARIDRILAFADIGDFVHQPVKTYSSGMFVRLAFATATSVSPDILVIDEALSVGDGAFARKSFDRIMDLKDAGATILFCSHGMYHVQALCSRAMWLESGRLRMIDTAQRVTAAYEVTLRDDTGSSGKGSLTDELLGMTPKNATPAHDAEAATDAEEAQAGTVVATPDEAAPPKAPPPPPGAAALHDIVASVDGDTTTPLIARSGRSELALRIRFASDPALPCPSLAIGIENASGTVVTSALSASDGVVLTRDADGYGEAVVRFEKLPLLRGDYLVSVILACERALHVYEIAQRVVALQVEQTSLELGLVTLPHRWESSSGA
jgi:lipopolysaccharide transport system ATP-binding protein